MLRITCPRTRKALLSGLCVSAVTRTLSLNRKQERLLEGFRDPAQKTRGVGAIDQPVIVREGERQNQAPLEFVVHPLRLHARTREAQNRDFGMIHDRRKPSAADST